MELLDLAILILVGILWWATRSGASARKLADETIASLSAAGQSDREALAAKLCSATARARFALTARPLIDRYIAADSPDQLPVDSLDLTATGQLIVRHAAFAALGAEAPHSGCTAARAGFGG